MDSAVGVLPELAEDGAGREAIDDTPVRLSFFRTGSLDRFHGPVPFSVFKQLARFLFGWHQPLTL